MKQVIFFLFLKKTVIIYLVKQKFVILDILLLKEAKVMRQKQLHNEEETLKIGERVGESLLSGDVLVLTGELGAGKTTFTKGLAKGLAIDQMVKSPTYTIVREYQAGRIPLYHMDVYRLSDGDGESIGFEEYFDQEGVVVVEWGTNLLSELPADYVEVILMYEPETDGRKVIFHSFGVKGKQLKERILRILDENEQLN